MAECPTIAKFKEWFNAFQSQPDGTIQRFLDEACSIISEALDDGCYERAVLYYTAHLLALDIRTRENSSAAGVPSPDASGLLSGSSADGLSVSYTSRTADSSSEAWLQSTPYGQRYFEIIKECSCSTSLAW